MTRYAIIAGLGTVLAVILVGQPWVVALLWGAISTSFAAVALGESTVPVYFAVPAAVLLVRPQLFAGLAHGVQMALISGIALACTVLAILAMVSTAHPLPGEAEDRDDAAVVAAPAPEVRETQRTVQVVEEA